MSAETKLLGAVLTDNRVWWAASKHVRGEDFHDPRLGAAWDGFGRDISRGAAVDMSTAHTRFPEWGVRGLPSSAPTEWWAAADGVAVYAVDYARTVAADATRRFGVTHVGSALAELNDPGSDAAGVLSSLASQIRDRGTRDTSLTALSLRSILDMPDAFDWVVPGVLERQDRLILTGAEGLGKSTMARQLLILPAAGLHPFEFTRIEPVRALVIDAENTARQWKRASGWIAHQARMQGGTDPTGNVTIVSSGRIDLLDVRVQGQRHRLIDEHKPDVVFIGPLYRLAVRMTTDEDAAPIIAALDSIRDRQVALVVEAHSGHATDVSGQRAVRPRGSSAFMGWPEFGFGIRASEDTGLFDFVAWRGAREERAFPRQLRRGVREAAEFPWVPVEVAW